MPACLYIYICSFNNGDTERTDSSKFMFDVCVYVFYLVFVSVDCFGRLDSRKGLFVSVVCSGRLDSRKGLYTRKSSKCAFAYK